MSAERTSSTVPNGSTRRGASYCAGSIPVAAIAWASGPAGSCVARAEQAERAERVREAIDVGRVQDHGHVESLGQTGGVPRVVHMAVRREDRGRTQLPFRHDGQDVVGDACTGVHHHARPVVVDEHRAPGPEDR